MAYFQSDTVAERPATHNSSKDEYTLYVKNLPDELNEDGIKQVFNHYGKIIGLFYRRDATWAYVTYKTYHEAEAALKDLHNNSPLYLEVSFAKEKSNNNRIQVKEVPASHSAPYDTPYSNESDMQPLPYAKGRGMPIYPAQKNMSGTGIPIHNYTKDDDLLYPYPTDPHTYNPYENAEPYSNTNALWTRGQLTITQDGKRHVSLGRGYTMYQIPDPHPEIQSHINKVYEKRHTGMYEFRKDKLGHAIGKCQKCLKVTKLTCERCHGFYCSKSCQVADWSKHKSQCEAIPGLVSTVESMSFSKNEEQLPARSIFNTNTPLRRPKMAAQINEMKNASPKQTHEVSRLSAETKNGVETHRNISSDINDIAIKPLIEKPHSSENVASPSRIIEKLRKINPVSKLLDNQSNSPAMKQNFNTQDITKVESDFAFERNIFLPKEKFVKIRIIAKLSIREYSIQKVEDDDDLRTLMLNLQGEADKSEKVQPILGNIYAAKYEQIWHRVLVTSVKPLKVQYMDYGNEEVLKDDDIRAINVSKNTRKLAGTIRFSEKAMAKHKDFAFEQELYVKMLSIDSNKVIDVEIQGENDEPNPPLKNVNNISIPAAATKVMQTEINSSPINNQSTPVAMVPNITSPPRSIEKLRKQSPITKFSDNQSNAPTMKRSFNSRDITKVEDDIAFERNTFLSKEKFIKIRIVAELNSREYSVQKVEDDDDIRTLMMNLQSEADKSEKVPPIFGNIYAAKYEQIWHRALVTSVKPLKVQYIDYGNEEVLKDDDIRTINESKNTRKLAGTIRFSEKAMAKHKHFAYEQELYVKMLSIDANKVIDVEIQGENDEPLKNVNNIPTTAPAAKLMQTEIKPSPINNISNPVAKVSNVVDMLNVTETGILEVHAELSNNTYCITLLVKSLSEKFESLLSELPEMCEKSTISNHSPRLGELICGQRADGDWFRGKILSQETPLKMVIIDEARVMPVVKTLPCPEKFLDIPAFGAVCTLVDTNEKLQREDQLNFEARSCIIDHGKNEVVVAISRGSGVLKAIIKPWVPAPEQKGVQYAQVKSGSEVCLTAYRSQNLLFVRPLDTPEVEQYNLIMQKVAKCAQSAPPFKAPPVVGEMVIALYADDNYYRAIVTKIEDNKVAISYVDFGNVETTTVDKLRVLSNDLKQLQSCAAKIVLKNVPHDVPLTKEANDFLVSLVGREVPLTCTFDGVPSTDGVHLKLVSGESINDKIIEFLTPSWKRTENDNRCYMLQDLKVTNLGEIGACVDVFVSCVITEGHTYALSPLDEALITHIFDVMPTLMKKYCESNEYYIPRDNELCLALVQGAWYRGLCLQRAETSIASSIFLVDSGEIVTVEHKNIRLMPKDFLTPEALASICTIVNLSPANSEGEYSAKIQERISQLIIINDYIKIKIVSCSADGTYDVEVPLVREKLIEEGFVPR